MSVGDIKANLGLAVEWSKVSRAKVNCKPRRLSDNGPCYLPRELAEYLGKLSIDHVRSAPYHPLTQGKIEHYRRSLKNLINLDHLYFPGELEKEIKAFEDYYRWERYHESLNNLTPEDVHWGRGRKILNRRKAIKR